MCREQWHIKHNKINKEKQRKTRLAHLRKSDDHRILKKQLVLWQQYHIMDSWCKCHWRNCHLCLHSDGFFPHRWTWKWSKHLAALFSVPITRFDDDALETEVEYFSNFTVFLPFASHHTIFHTIWHSVSAHNKCHFILSEPHVEPNCIINPQLLTHKQDEAGPLVELHGREKQQLQEKKRLRSRQQQLLRKLTELKRSWDSRCIWNKLPHSQWTTLPSSYLSLLKSCHFYSATCLM